LDKETVLNKRTFSYEEFMQQKDRVRLVFFSKQALCDLDTPLSCYIKMKKAFFGKPAFLLESVEQKERLGRFSIIGFEPFLIFKSIEKEVILEGIIEDHFETENPFLVLKEIFKKFHVTVTGNDIACYGGAVGYAGYDVVRFFEKLPSFSKKTIDTYDMYFVFPARLIVFDNFTRRITFLLLDSLNATKNVTKVQKELDRLYKLLRSPVQLTEGPSFEIKGMKHLLTKEEFEALVLKAKEYILRGDVIQVVISQRFEMEADVDSLSLYRALRVVNPSPYMFLLEFPEYSIIGSSPETMVKMEKGVVEVRPIAGTRRRGKTKEEDEKLARELLTDEKELAEHTMLVDLGRNDVGRIAETGSVIVSDLMNIEKYSHVMHLVSSVKGKVKDNLDAFHVFEATFPAGTVTGAPKIRAMEIIEELEKIKRGFYAGAVGYFSYNGDMDFCITIRTFLKKENKVYIQTGAGIVADSVPENEYMETLYKAGGLIKSIKEIKEIIG